MHFEHHAGMDIIYSGFDVPVRGSSSDDHGCGVTDRPGHPVQVTVFVSTANRYGRCALQMFAGVWRHRSQSAAYRALDSGWQLPRRGHLPFDGPDWVGEARWLDPRTLVVLLLCKREARFDQGLLVVAPGFGFDVVVCSR
jgi:hypothetical protein